MAWPKSGVFWLARGGRFLGQERRRGQHQRDKRGERETAHHEVLSIN
jgi:hypothetical protein